MRKYLNQLEKVLIEGTDQTDRTGVGTKSIFGLQERYKMSEGFPAVTTKKLAWKVMASELLWFISGSSNLKDLKAIYPENRIWDANYEDYSKRTRKNLDGDMGRIYGCQWRNWVTAEGKIVDQLQDAIDLLRQNPDSRRIIVSSWNPGEIEPEQVALPPCHSFFQFYVSNNKLSLHMYQRSADMFLGVPFNIASYSLLLHIVAMITNLEADEFVHTIGDAHIYLNAVDQVKLQLKRDPKPLPELHIESRGQEEIDDFLLKDFHLRKYKHHEPIAAKMAV